MKELLTDPARSRSRERFGPRGSRPLTASPKEPCGINHPTRSKDGRELFYVKNDTMKAVEVTPEPTFTYSSPRVLFQGHYVPGVHTGAHWVNYDVTADGMRFVLVRLAEATGTARFDVILNWHETFKRIGDGR